MSARIVYRVRERSGDIKGTYAEWVATKSEYDSLDKDFATAQDAADAVADLAKYPTYCVITMEVRP